MIVALEAIDAGGKATQAEAVFKMFSNPAFANHIAKVKKFDFPHYTTTAGGVVGRILRGETVVYTQEDYKRFCAAVPDGSTALAAARWEVMQKSCSRDKAIVIQSVMLVDRLEHLPMLIEYAQSPDSLLILDRYKMSGIAYGNAEGIDAEWLRSVHNCLPDADLNIYLDISVEESMRRRPERRDWYERNTAMLQCVRDIYLHEFDAADDRDFGYCVIAGDQPQEAITEQIVAAIWDSIEVIGELVD